MASAVTDLDTTDINAWFARESYMIGFLVLSLPLAPALRGRCRPPVCRRQSAYPAPSRYNLRTRPSPYRRTVGDLSLGRARIEQTCCQLSGGRCLVPCHFGPTDQCSDVMPKLASMRSTCGQVGVQNGCRSPLRSNLETLTSPASQSPIFLPLIQLQGLLQSCHDRNDYQTPMER